MAIGNPGSDSTSGGPPPKTYRFPIWVIVLAVIPVLFLPFMKPRHPKSAFVGTPAPELKFVDLAGKRHSLSEYRGTPLLVNFWASWCEPCMEEMPALRELESRLKSKLFHLLMLNVAENQEDVFKRISPGELPSLVFFGVSEDALDAYKIGSIPVSFLIDRNGAVAQSYLGPRPWTAPEILGEIESVL